MRFRAHEVRARFPKFAARLDVQVVAVFALAGYHGRIVFGNHVAGANPRIAFAFGPAASWHVVRSASRI